MRPDPLENKLRRVVTATAVFLLAYLVSISAYQLLTGFICFLLDYEPTITFNALLDLPIRPDLWSKFRVAAVFGSGMLWLLLSGVGAFIAFSRQSGRVTLMRSFLLWYGLLSVNLLLTYMATGAAGAFDLKWGLYQGVALVFAWWKIPAIIAIPIAILATIVSIVMGYIVSPAFLKFIYSSRRAADNKGRLLFLILTYVLPILIGGVLLFPLLTEYSLILHLCIMLNLVLISFGIFLRSEYLQLGVKAHKADVLNAWPLQVFMPAGLLYLLVLFVFK